MAVSMYGRNASVRTPHAGGGAGTSRTEPKGMGAGGPQRVAAWVDAQGGRTRRSASLPFVLAGPDLSGTLQGVDGAAGANHISAFGANGNVRLDADCMVSRCWGSTS